MKSIEDIINREIEKLKQGFSIKLASFAHQIFKMIVSHTNWLFYTSIIFTTVAIVNIESFI